MAGTEPAEGKSAASGSLSKDATVSRAAWLFGWAVGLGTAIGGYFAIQALGLPKWASVPLEMAAMALALVLTTTIWRRSARSMSGVEYEEDPKR